MCRNIKFRLLLFVLVVLISTFTYILSLILVVKHDNDIKKRERETTCILLFYKLNNTNITCEGRKCLEGYYYKYTINTTYSYVNDTTMFESEQKAMSFFKSFPRKCFYDIHLNNVKYTKSPLSAVKYSIYITTSLLFIYIVSVCNIIKIYTKLKKNYPQQLQHF